MARIRKKKIKDFDFEIIGKVYRHPKGAFMRKNDGSFIKVGSGKGKYSLKVEKIRKKKFF